MKNTPTKQEESLNIEWHTKVLVLKALNKCKSTREAADELGMTERNLYALKQIYRIKKVSRYVVKDKFKIVNTF